jgi:tRNA threonylcarbamoyladenosine biosynthesis protein TsaB
VRILALETSGTGGSVAAFDGDTLLVERVLTAGQRSAQALAPAIAQTLADAGWQSRDVQLVAVTRGPGSFTGLRVGVTTAKLFAYAVGCEVLGVNTLEVIAAQAPQQAQRLVAAIDAQRQEVYLGSFARDAAGLWQWCGEPAIVPIDDLLAHATGDTMLSGPALSRLSQPLPPEHLIAPRETWSPTAASVGRVAARHHAAGQRDDPFTLLPLYLRRSAAEEKLEERTADRK